MALRIVTSRLARATAQADVAARLQLGLPRGEDELGDAPAAPAHIEGPTRLQREDGSVPRVEAYSCPTPGLAHAS